MLGDAKLLLPALLPSWRFFDTIGPSPRIEFALLNDACDTPKHWQEFRPRPAYLSLLNMLKCLFWNPQWNTSLFLVSCAERVLETPDDPRYHQLVSRISAGLHKDFPVTTFFQFRLVCLSRQGVSVQTETAYQSSIYSLKSPDHVI